MRRSLFLLASFFVLWLSSGKIRSFATQSSDELTITKLHRQTVDLALLGHRAVFDDFLYLWLLQSLAPSARSLEVQRPRPSAEGMRNSIMRTLQFKPRIESVYLLSCFVLAFDYKHPEWCESISNLGLEEFPQSWRIPMTQGYMLAFPLKKPLNAAFYYYLASERPNSPPYVISLAKKLLAKQTWTSEEEDEVLHTVLKVSKDSSFLNFLQRR